MAERSDTARYLRIHFAPQTACVDVQISDAQYERLLYAMNEHDGDVSLQISCRSTVSLKVAR